MMSDFERSDRIGSLRNTAYVGDNLSNDQSANLFLWPKNLSQESLRF